MTKWNRATNPLSRGGGNTREVGERDLFHFPWIKFCICKK